MGAIPGEIPLFNPFLIWYTKKDANAAGCSTIPERPVPRQTTKHVIFLIKRRESTMELETVLYRTEGPVAIISLNRTKAMNSLNKQIFADLTTAFQAAKDDDAIRCVIMNGEGRAFCAGGDIAEMKSITTEEVFFDFMTVAGGFTTLLNTFPKPVIAAAHGAIAGAGTSLVMAADIALVADNAMFIVAFGQVGLIPDCACHYLLPRVVGPNMAKELMLTQRPVKADEMKTLGIANRVVPADQLMDEAMKLAQKIAKGPLNCYSMSKALMNKSHECSLEEILKEETAAQASARMNVNAEEGLGAFLEKRKAVFH